MQCFIHPKKEATSSCTKCGKAMCVDCSSFSEHSGICPACKKTDMDKEIAQIKKQIEFKKSSISTRLILSICFFFLILPLCLYPRFKRKVNREIALLETKIESIQKSLRFVDEALKRGSGSLEVNSKSEQDEISGDAWQCPFCRTINNGSKTCKFCARKRP